MRTALLIIALSGFAVAFNPASDSSLLIIDKYAPLQSSIDEISIADYVSFAIGGGVVNPEAPRDALPLRPVFDKARANLLVIVDGVASQLVAAPVATALEAVPNSRFVDLFKNTEAEHSVQTLLTGDEAASFADLLSQAHNGQALTVGMSGDLGLASSLAVHKVNSRNSNDLAFAWSSKESKLQLVNEAVPIAGSELPAFNAKLVDDMLRAAAWPGVEVRVGAAAVDAVLASGASATFIFEDETDLRFLVELAFLRGLPTLLRSSSGLSALAADQVPDSYTVAFSTLRHLSGDKLAVAEYLVAQCFAQALAELSALYDGKMTAELVFFAAPTTPRLQARMVQDDGNSTNPYYDDTMATFQIVLWTSISLGLMSIAVVYVMVALGSSGQADSILIRNVKSS